MKVCLLTQYPSNHASQRLMEEARGLGIEPQIKTLQDCRVHWPLTFTTQTFDLTLNRISSVENDSLIPTMMEWPVWGRQVNAWEIRQKLWDKTRQALWLSNHSLPVLPFFTHRGPLSPDDPTWKAFSQACENGKARQWVLKLNRGQRGVGVHFFDDENELMSWLETLYRLGDQDFFIQPRLPSAPEYRVTLLGDRPWSVLERRGVVGRPANAAQAGEARELPVDEWPQSIRHLVDRFVALKAADVLSIDLLISSDGPVVSDINPVPGFEQLEAVTGRNFARDLWSYSLSL